MYPLEQCHALPFDVLTGSPKYSLPLQISARHTLGGGQHPVIPIATGVMGAGDSPSASYHD